MTTTPDNVKPGSPLDIALRAAAKAGVNRQLVAGRWRVSLTLDNLAEVAGAVHLSVTDKSRDAWSDGVRWAAAEADAQAAGREPVVMVDVTDHLRACADNPERHSVVPRDQAPTKHIND
jgi:hypothetical protein